MILRLFFSWQVESDTARQHNKPFIWDCINAAVKRVQDTGELKGVFIKPEEGVREEPGNPDTVDVCEKRIDNCHIFIGDMTISDRFIFIERFFSFLSNRKHRVGPNRNVNNEYGRVKGLKNDGQIITVMNTINGDVNEKNDLFPIDIRKYRFPIKFLLKKDEKYCDKKKFKETKERFVVELSDAIRSSAKVALEHIDDEMKPFIKWDTHKKTGDFRGGYADTPDLIELKKQISENQGNIRLLGMSGLGKTRLVLEAFKSNKDIYWYYDCQNGNIAGLKERLPFIFSDFSNYVLVFDNCNKATSNEIAQLKRSCQGTNPIITIYNGLEESSDGLYTPLSMQDKYDAVVEVIIKRYSVLYQDKDKERIMDFAGGIPMMAQLLMDGLRANKVLGDVTDETLMSKLLLTEAGSDDRRLMQTISLFDFIGFRGDARNEIAYVINNKDITNIDKSKEVLLNSVDELIERNLKRRIMEQRGRRVGIRPAPIAFYLIGEWLSNCSDERMLRVVKALQETDCADALTNAFADQFRNMGFNEKARQMLNHLMGPNSPFSSAEVINTRLGSRLFRSFAEVNPVVVANTLWSTLSAVEIEKLRLMKEGRRNLVWTVEKLCFDPMSFVPAAKLMLRLAQAENEDLGNNATHEFIRLFPVYLPATATNLDTRLKFLEEMFVIEENKPMLFRAIKTALHTRDFIYMGGAEKQGLKTFTNYQPQSGDEMERYLEGCINLLLKEIKPDSPYLDVCTDIVEADFNSLCLFGAAKYVLPCLDKLAVIKNNDWDEMLDNLYLLKTQKVRPLSPAFAKEIDKKIELLTKTDFVSRFLYVTKRHRWESSHDWEQQMKYDSAQYKDLADELVRDKLYDIDLLRNLFALEILFVEPFGSRIAEVISDNEKSIFFNNALNALAPDKNLGYSIVNQFLRVVDEKFYSFAHSELMKRKEYRLVCSTVAVRGYDMKHQYTEELFLSLEKGEMPLDYIQQYWSNLLHNQLIDDNITYIFDRVAKIPNGIEYVLWMAGALTYNGNLKNRPKTEKVLVDLVMNFTKPDLAEFKSESFWQLIFMLLEDGQKKDLAKIVHNRILTYMETDNAIYIGNYNIERAYAILLEKYFDVIWPDLSSALSGQNVWLSYHLQQILGDKISNTILSPGLLFRQDYADTLFKWCDENPQKNAPLLMSMAPVEGENDTFSAIVMELINRYGYLQSVLDSLSSNMGSFSFVGSVQPLYESHIRMLQGLNNHSIERVRIWASKMIVDYEKMLAREKDFEEEEGIIRG